jgi:4-hydroxybenzoyl-CoA reductase subunit beta
LPTFNYYRPESLSEALELLVEFGTTCRILAGGTELLVALKQRRLTSEQLMDLCQLDELTKIEMASDGRLKIGTMVTLTQVAESSLVKSFSPALAKAAWETGSPLLRNRGTIGGNIFQDSRCRYYNQSANWRKGKATCLKMNGQVCHINPGGKRCLSTYAGDLAPVLIAEEATIELATVKGNEEIQLTSIFTGDGTKPHQLDVGTLATAIYISQTNKGQNTKSTYWKLRSRPSIDFPLVGLAVVIEFEDQSAQKIAQIKIGVTGTSSKPQLAFRTGEALAGGCLNQENLTKAQEYLLKEIKVVDTGNSPAWYRKQMLGQGFLETIDRLLGEGGNV